MSGGLRVWRGGPSDLDAAVRLFQGYLDFYGKDHPPENSRAFVQARLENGDSRIFLAAIDDRAVGFTQLYPAFASLSLAPSWILNDLFVNSTARGQGVGEALMQAARDLAVDTAAAEIFLQTARDNESAQRLYRRLGYQRDDEFLVYTLGMAPPRPLPKGY